MSRARCFSSRRNDQRRRASSSSSSLRGPERCSSKRSSSGSNRSSCCGRRGQRHSARRGHRRHRLQVRRWRRGGRSFPGAWRRRCWKRSSQRSRQRSLGVKRCGLGGISGIQRCFQLRKLAQRVGRELKRSVSVRARHRTLQQPLRAHLFVACALRIKARLVVIAVVLQRLQDEAAAEAHASARAEARVLPTPHAGRAW